MNLLNSSVELLVQLEAASVEDASDELIGKAQLLAEVLNDVSARIEAVACFRESVGDAGAPKIDARQITKSVNAFRSGLERHGSGAIHHKPADTLKKEAESARRSAVKWANDAWQSRFYEIEPILEQVNTGADLAGSRSGLTVRARVASLTKAQGLDPTEDTKDLQDCLGGDSVEEWLEGIERLTSELRVALDAVEQEHNALSPEVQEVLERASADEGMPLDDLTPELLRQLSEASVNSRLIIRSK